MTSNQVHATQAVIGVGIMALVFFLLASDVPLTGPVGVVVVIVALADIGWVLWSFIRPPRTGGGR